MRQTIFSPKNLKEKSSRIVVKMLSKFQKVCLTSCVSFSLFILTSHAADKRNDREAAANQTLPPLRNWLQVRKKRCGTEQDEVVYVEALKQRSEVERLLATRIPEVNHKFLRAPQGAALKLTPNFVLSKKHRSKERRGTDMLEEGVFFLVSYSSVPLSGLYVIISPCLFPVTGRESIQMSPIRWVDGLRLTVELEFCPQKSQIILKLNAWISVLVG